MAQIEDPANLARWDDPGRWLITLILIHCGLRIGDACKLPADCVVHDRDGRPYLCYYNHKMKREALVPTTRKSSARSASSSSGHGNAGPAAPPCCSPGPPRTSTTAHWLAAAPTAAAPPLPGTPRLPRRQRQPDPAHPAPVPPLAGYLPCVFDPRHDEIRACRIVPHKYSVPSVRHVRQGRYQSLSLFAAAYLYRLGTASGSS
jgi:hypothetical protein